MFVLVGFALRFCQSLFVFAEEAGVGDELPVALVAAKRSNRYIYTDSLVGRGSGSASTSGRGFALHFVVALAPAHHAVVHLTAHGKRLPQFGFLCRRWVDAVLDGTKLHTYCATKPNRKHSFGVTFGLKAEV